MDETTPVSTEQGTDIAVIDHDRIEIDRFLKANNYIEIISTDDARLKIIGKELADDTGRAIFTTICQRRAISSNDLAKCLDVSLPLVNWHINRLMNAGMIKIEKTEMSQKNKPVKFYGAAKTVLVIVSGEEDENDEISKGNNPSESGKTKTAIEILWSKFNNKRLIPAVSLVAGTLAIYVIAGLGTGSGRIRLVDPDAVSSFPPNPLSSLLYGILPAYLADILTALFGGAIIAIAVSIVMKKVARRSQVIRA